MIMFKDDNFFSHLALSLRLNDLEVTLNTHSHKHTYTGMHTLTLQIHSSYKHIILVQFDKSLPWSYCSYSDMFHVSCVLHSVHNMFFPWLLTKRESSQHYDTVHMIHTFIKRIALGHFPPWHSPPSAVSAIWTLLYAHDQAEMSLAAGEQAGRQPGRQADRQAVRHCCFCEASGTVSPACGAHLACGVHAV